MPRLRRLAVPDVALHVVQRGNDRQPCFNAEGDYLVYLACLRELSGKAGCAIHAYCLMTNHVHLLLTPGRVGACSALMRNLGQRYVQYFNRRYERTGTLWEGRFRSCLVESSAYVLACYRYIERNPVRAGMVGVPLSYRWSSHAGNVGAFDDPLLTAHAEYLALAGNEAARKSAYGSLFDVPDTPDFLAAVRDATLGGFALTSEALKPRIAALTGRRVERGKPGRPAERGAGADPSTGEIGL